MFALSFGIFGIFSDEYYICATDCQSDWQTYKSFFISHLCVNYILYILPRFITATNFKQMNGSICKRLAVKIGSNVLTRKDGTLDVTRMSAIVDQVAELYKSGVEIILVSSGAVASGRS